MTRYLSPLAWKIIIATVLVLSLGLLVKCSVDGRRKLQEEAAISRAERAISQGDSLVAKVAIEQVSDLDERQALRERLANEVAQDIRTSDDPNAAFLRGLCKSAAYANTRQCNEMRKSDPGEH